MSSDSVDVPVNITVNGADDADSQLSTMSTNWDKVGLSGAGAARSLTNGLGGLLSAQQNVYNAQQRVNVANINYVLTVREYGAGSIQAQKALIQLNQAQQSVSIAQDQMDLQFVKFALTTGPQVYTSLIKMAAAFQGVTVADFELNAGLAQTAVLAALTIGILTAGIAIFGGLVAGAQASGAVNSAQAANPVTIQQTNTYASPRTGNASHAAAQLVGAVRNAVRP